MPARNHQRQRWKLDLLYFFKFWDLGFGIYLKIGIWDLIFILL